MPQPAQNNDGKNNLGFTTVQAYTLAVITLAIGITVGYFARGSAPVPSSSPTERAEAATPRQTLIERAKMHGANAKG